MTSKNKEPLSYTKVGSVDDFPEGKGRSVIVEGKKLAVFHVDGEFFALLDECTHAQAPLSRGTVKDGCVQCPMHGAQFDLRTGSVMTLQATRNVEMHDVKLVGSGVFVSRRGRTAEPMWKSGRRFDQGRPDKAALRFEEEKQGGKKDKRKAVS
jgi:3-phenylpropionate/trans-cinnamate dioxygenase ferredoxin subunit